MNARLGQELRDARIERGLILRAAATAGGVSHAELSRIEHGSAPWVTVLTLARCAAVVGLDLSVRLFPGGVPFRDAGQLVVLGTFRGLLHPSLGWSTEVPTPIPGDLRAWDGLVRGDGWAYGVEVEGLPHDAQALGRRLHLKLRDSAEGGAAGGVKGVLLVIRDTARNRRFIRDTADILMPEFPIPSWRALQALREGRDPGGSSIIFVTPPSAARPRGVATPR